MKVVIIGNSHLDQFKPNRLLPNENILQFPGASIRGLRNDNSFTGLNRKIKDSCADAYIFHLGLVDIEFGYYYKSYLINEKINKQEFIKDTTSIYLNYLKSLNTNKIIIVGLNPTVITDNRHIFKVNFEDNPNNTLQETGKGNNEVTYEDLSHIYNDTIEERNIFLKDMNEALKIMCNENNFIFYDLWDELFDNDKMYIKNIYIPPVVDHHLVANETIYNKLQDMINLINC